MDKAMDEAREKASVEERVKKIILEVDSSLTKDKIVPQANLKDDLGLNSDDFVDIIRCIEAEFRIGISDDEAEKVKTFGDLCNLVKRKVF